MADTDYRDKALRLVAEMTLEEKASLCSGQSFWNLQAIERLGLKPIMVTDGPHGLRKQAGATDQLGLNESIPSTCFPLACASACSFDVDLLHEVGVAIAEECRQEQVSVVLGPGVNIKRNPLCGRNFEYFSEDPLLAGEMGRALVQGVQSLDIGTSVKHYAANNQETRRTVIDSVVDIRALREIYLAPYERIVKAAQPWTLMCSYNKVNGTFASDNRWLLTDVPRGEWGFEGSIMSDWGATDDRVIGVHAGLDLEMPSSNGMNDRLVLEAVGAGTLAEEDLDQLATRIATLILRSMDALVEGYTYDAQAHHALARKAAEQSSVLLKNEDRLLPLSPDQDIAVIGAFAKQPRYQGAGSSKINPTRIESAVEALESLGLGFGYADGYHREKGADPDETLIAEACALAAGKDAVVIFAGLPEEYESEGFDRLNMDMPASHVQLIERVAAVNPNVVVVLQLGAPVELPWRDKVKSILVSYLGGQAVGGAEANLLLGHAVPCAKLAETWPLFYEDTPSSLYFPGGSKSVEYRESVFVGYRYFDSASRQVAYPFGHGLSYTEFSYSDLHADKDRFERGGRLAVGCTVENTGTLAGSEVVQLYVGLPDSSVYRPRKELRAFAKVELQPGESKQVTLELDDRSFAYYHEAEGTWAIEEGCYEVMLGASSADIRLKMQVQVDGDGKEQTLAGLFEKLPHYFTLPDGPLEIPDKEFEALYGRPLPPSERVPGTPFDINSTLNDIKDTKAGKLIAGQLKRQTQAMLGDGMSDDVAAFIDASINDMPLRSMLMLGGEGITRQMVDGMVDLANGKTLRGYFNIWRGRPKK